MVRLTKKKRSKNPSIASASALSSSFTIECTSSIIPIITFSPLLVLHHHRAGIYNVIVSVQLNPLPVKQLLK